MYNSWHHRLSLVKPTYYPFDRQQEKFYEIDINNDGVICGSYVDSSNGNQYGYLYNGTSFTIIQYPNMTNQVATGINDDLQVAGCYIDSNNVSQMTQESIVQYPLKSKVPRETECSVYTGHLTTPSIKTSTSPCQLWL